MTTVPPDDPGGARSSDPITSYMAAHNVKAIAALERGVLQALRFADQYPLQCMTSFDVARRLGRFNARDSYSPRMSKMNRWGLIMYVCRRPCENAAGDMQEMQAFRLRKPGDPDFMLSPSNRTRMSRLLAAWKLLATNEREDFMANCAGPIPADYALLLWRRMSEEERAVMLEWITGPDRGMGVD